MPETTESTPLETTPVEQPTEQPQEVQPSEQPVTTPEATPTETPAPQEQPQVTEEPLKPFELPIASEQQQQTQPEPITLETVVEKFGSDKQALLKALGFDDTILRVVDFYEKERNFEPIVKVLSTDWTKMPAERVIEDKLREQYAQYNLTEAQVQKMVAKDLRTKYLIGEDYESESEEVELAKIQMEIDAADHRQKRIAEQSQFKAPERVVEEAKPQAPQPTYEQIVEQRRNELLGQKAVQEFMTRKTIKVGDFTYEVDNPQENLAILYDDNRFLYHTSVRNEKGEVVMQNGQPVRDTEALIQIAAFARDRQGFMNKLIEHGKTLGKKAIVDEAENVVDNKSFGAQKEPDDLYAALARRLQQG
jgi:hypothetical protein